MSGRSIRRSRKREIRRHANLNTHHLIPRSKNGGSHPDNLVECDRRIHTAFHIAFGNRAPRECFELATADPHGVACRVIYALVHQFGASILSQFQKAA